MTTIPTIPDRQLREDIRAFVLAEAEPWHREHLGKLYRRWEEWNAAHYASQLIPPYILLTPPESPRAYGDCAGISSFGGRCQIRIRPSLLTGTHPHMRKDDAYAEGRFLFIADVLLHEQIHQYHFEITSQTEDSYHGHGPAFAAICNQIGQTLGLPPVRSMKKRGKDKELPSCAHWPHNVRPPEYYLGAYKHGQADTGEQNQGDGGSGETKEADASNPLAELLDQVIANLDAGAIERARQILTELRKRM